MDKMREEQECFIPTIENTDTFEATVRVELPGIKKVAKQNVAKLFKEKSEEEASKIPFQGALLTLLAQEKEDISWQGLIYKVPSCRSDGLGRQGRDQHPGHPRQPGPLGCQGGH